MIFACYRQVVPSALGNDMAKLLLEIKATVAETPAPAVGLSPSQREAFARRYDDAELSAISPRGDTQLAKMAGPLDRYCV